MDAGSDDTPGHDPTTIVVAVCTYKRNEPLRRLLSAIEDNARSLGSRASVGVVVVDDNPDGAAKVVTDEFSDAFALGLHYRTSGEGNISIARNIGLETALPLAEWVAMTDDDCVPPPGWLGAHLDALHRFGTDTVTGPCYLTVPPGAPRWLTDQPFHEDAQLRYDAGERLDIAATNNSMSRTAFFDAHPELRFEPELGVVGGEDMVFFRSASRAGLTIAFSPDGQVEGHEAPERCTLGYQIRSRYWIGNTEWVTNRFLGDATRPWWLLRGAKALALGAARPFVRLGRRESPQWRYALAAMARGTGMLAGAAGVRVDHH